MAKPSSTTQKSIPMGKNLNQKLESSRRDSEKQTSRENKDLDVKRTDHGTIEDSGEEAAP